LEIFTAGDLAGHKMVPVIPREAIRAAALESGMEMLVLFGSRVRGQEHARSDWDFGYQAGEQSDLDLLRTRLAKVLATDSIDLVDLARATALLRMRVAAEGQPLFEAQPGLFMFFQDETARFWCDVEPVLSRAYAGILERARSA
jgi:uncharacterized protein